MKRDLNGLIVYIEPHETGVLLAGDSEELISTGYHLRFPWDKMWAVDMRDQSVSSQIEAITKDHYGYQVHYQLGFKVEVPGRYIRNAPLDLERRLLTIADSSIVTGFTSLENAQMNVSREDCIDIFHKAIIEVLPVSWGIKVGELLVPDLRLIRGGVNMTPREKGDFEYENRALIEPRNQDLDIQLNQTRYLARFAQELAQAKMDTEIEKMRYSMNIDNYISLKNADLECLDRKMRILTESFTRCLEKAGVEHANEVMYFMLAKQDPDLADIYRKQIKVNVKNRIAKKTASVLGISPLWARAVEEFSDYINANHSLESTDEMLNRKFRR